MAADEDVDLWATDEVHFQQYGSRCRMWVPPEDRQPVLLHYPGRRSVGYFGAVRVRDGKFVFQREAESFNAMTFHAFLKRWWAVASKSRRSVALIIDNVRYHHANLHRPWREERAQRLQPHFMPAYSPELNPIERLWKLTRRLCLHNRYFSSLAEVTAAAEGQFAQWADGSETVKKLCTVI